MITSRSNPWFRRFREAIEHHGEEIVLEGPKQVADAVALGWKPIALLRTESSPAGEGIVVDPRLLQSLGDTSTSQGVLALFPRPEIRASEVLQRAGSTIVVLDGVQDPGNVGTVMRLAAAFNCGGVLLTEGSADPWSQKSIRASAATVLLIPVARTTRQEVLQGAAALGVPLFWATAGGASGTLPKGRSLLVMGSEGRGVSAEFVEAGSPISVAMSPRVESLNVAAAAAILLHGAFDR